MKRLKIAYFSRERIAFVIRVDSDRMSLIRAICLLMVMAAAGIFVEVRAAEPRLALVIGNSDYRIGPLKNPANDAALIAKVLRETGFTVTHQTDLKQREMLRTVVEFSRALKAAGDDAVGLFYYAGHAVQANGVNYLIPVDAIITDELDLRIQTLDSSTLMQGLHSAGNRLNLVFLDSCRNNPFQALNRSGTRGLAKIDAPSGTLIAYATAPGDVAMDGKGKNSPYTIALAKAIKQPNTRVEQALKQVRIEVRDRTGNKQTPWETSSLTGDFYFTGKAVVPNAVQSAALPPASTMDRTVEIEFWKSISDSDDPALFEAYLVQYPDGVFKPLAERKVATLTAKSQVPHNDGDLIFFQSIQYSNRPEDFEAYLSQYPDGNYVPIANARLKSLRNAAREEEDRKRQQNESAQQNSPQSGQDLNILEGFVNIYTGGLYGTVLKNDSDAALRNTQNDVASLNSGGTAENPYDGEWFFRAKTKSVSGRSDSFCRMGESGEVILSIRNGNFYMKAKSAWNTLFSVKGTVSSSGHLNLNFRPWGTSSVLRSENWTVTERIGPDSFLRTEAGKKCIIAFEMSKLQ